MAAGRGAVGGSPFDLMTYRWPTMARNRSECSAGVVSGINQGVSELGVIVPRVAISDESPPDSWVARDRRTDAVVGRMALHLADDYCAVHRCQRIHI